MCLQLYFGAGGLAAYWGRLPEHMPQWSTTACVSEDIDVEPQEAVRDRLRVVSL